jgi:hypothetical protein
VKPVPVLPTAVAALAVLLPAVTGAEDVDPRADLGTMEALLDRVVRRVSLPSAAPFFGAIEASRAYRIPGYGVVFVVPPRSLPAVRGLGLHPVPEEPQAVSDKPGPPAPDASEELRQAFAREEALRRSLAAERQQESRARTARERELKALEAKVEALSQEAERQRAEAERALDAAMQQVRIRLMAPRPGGPATPAAETAQPDVPPNDDTALLFPPAPPWRFWAEGPDDPRKPDQVVSDVRAVVVQALEAAGGRLRSVRPDEAIVVAVDFVPQWDFGDSVRADRTLVVRARKKDLVDHDAGKLSTEDLRKRVEIAEY